MGPITEKSHASDISYKAYMGKTIICRTLAMHEYVAIPSLWSCIRAWSPRYVYVYMYTGVPNIRTQDSPQYSYMCTKNLVSSMAGGTFSSAGG